MVSFFLSFLLKIVSVPEGSDAENSQVEDPEKMTGKKLVCCY